jgi:hypothetical protein
MMNSRTIAICGVGVVFLTLGLKGEGSAQYRNFELGSALASVSAKAGIPSSEATVIHQRPASLQDLEWRPSRWMRGATTASTDPVERIMFSFYNDQLFRMVIEYDRERTEGMTDADMIEAISATYGTPLARPSQPPVRPASPVRAASQVEQESGSPVARWGDAKHAVVLYRTTGYRGTLRLIMTEPTLDDLARKATMQARQLDVQEAPRLEIARQKKAGFRP